jgi:glycosyltransferase involved in cell wall biosynthesis
MPDKKKIILIGPAHPLRGGLAAFNERLAKELLADGFEVIIYTFSLQYPSFLFPGKSQTTTDLPPTDLKIKVKINSINPFNWISVGHEIKNENADFVIIRYWIPFMGPCLGTIARIVKKNKKTKLIGLLDNVIPHEKRPGDTAFTKYFVKPFDKFLAMSQQVYNDLRLFSNKPCTISPHPIYDQYGDIVDKIEACNFLNIDSSFNYILFFGFIRNYKGLDLLLEAFSNCEAATRNTKLIIAGEYYGEEEYYTKLIGKFNLRDKIILATNYISDAEVKYYFSASDVVVQPYKTATQSGISQIAYHFEKPMIVTNVGGLPEIVPDGISGLIAEVNIKSIQEKIDLFYNQNLADQLIKGVRLEKKKYSWQHFCKQLLS